MNVLAKELRHICGHDSRSVPGCLPCDAADAVETADRLLLNAQRYRALRAIADDHGRFSITANNGTDLDAFADAIIHKAQQMSAQGEGA